MLPKTTAFKLNSGAFCKKKKKKRKLSKYGKMVNEIHVAFQFVFLIFWML
jgi:hypothetical protein